MIYDQTKETYETFCAKSQKSEEKPKEEENKKVETPPTKTSIVQQQTENALENDKMVIDKINTD